MMENKRKKNIRKRTVKGVSGNYGCPYKPEVSINWFEFRNSQCFKQTLQPGNSVKPNSSVKRLGNRETSRTPKLTKVLALDCEMVGDMQDNSILGRVSIVNFNLECVYDKFVKPATPVGDYRTRFSGLRESDLKNGVDFVVVQREVRNILRNKIIVGHQLDEDFRVLKFGHFKLLIRDTTKFHKFRDIDNGKRPSLKKLVNFFLGENIQDGEHDSVEDAQAAMKLYIKYRHEWENSLLNERRKYQKNE